LRPSSDGPDDNLEDGLTKAGGPADAGLDDEAYLGDADWLRMFKAALKASSDFQQLKLKPAWSRNYRAFQNRHMNGSKYDSKRYRHRSKLFKPKTRMAVRKNDGAAASALFSTAEVVNIEAVRKSDRVQVATSGFIHAVLNYRFEESTRMTGPNWFMTAIGARQDTQLTGICVSKQHWEFEEREFEVLVTGPKMDENGIPVIDPETGEGSDDQWIEMDREKVRDRPMVTLLPPEHAFIDPTGDWRDPIQEGGYFIAGYPMRKEDCETTIQRNAARPMMGGGAWRKNIDLSRVLQARASTMRRNDGVRRAREDGIDRYESRHSDGNGEIIWLYECFYRYDGEDWHFWMLGETILLSDPRPTRDSYPEQKGDRPYTMGVGSLESHKTHPTAPVEMWQPLQQEMNDLTNLALDARKMAISPITKIVRGKNIDFNQVQNRGPDAAIMVEKPEDVTFDRAPADAGHQVEMNSLNVDFDELSGVFSTGSVQTNRQLNETVGGMNIMSAASNALTEFDLRVWAETWLEPTLRQVVRSIQFYESNEEVMGIAGERAGLIIGAQEPPQPGNLESVDAKNIKEPITFAEVMDAFGSARVSVRVNIGIGALDNRQKLEKFMGGVKMTMEMMPLLKQDGIVPDGAAMSQEGWGLLGYKDADRFFKRLPAGNEESPPPEVQKQLLDMKARKEEAERKTLADNAQMEREREKHEWARQDRAAEEAARQNQHAQTLQTQAADADGQRVAAGLPGDQAWMQMLQEMEAGRQQTMQMVTQLMAEMSTGQQLLAQAIERMAEAQAAPRTVVTPDGRTFTSVSQAK